MSTLRFILRTDKPDKEKLSPIQVIFSVAGQRAYYEPGIKLPKSAWDKDSQQVIANGITKTEKREVEAKLLDLEDQIKKAEQLFQLQKEAYTSASVIDRIKADNGKLGVKKQSSKALFAFIDQYVEDNAATRVKGSLQVYKSLRGHLEAYQKQTKKEVTFDSIDTPFFTSFQNFLIDRRGLNNNSTAKQLSTLRTFLNYAKQYGHTVSDKHKDFKIKRSMPDVVALTQQELQALIDLDLHDNKSLDQVRDCFVFACATGLRYSDVKALRWHHVKNGEIVLTVKKTKERLTVPLNPISLKILNKYKDLKRAYPLPVISNQKMNAYLKGWTEKDATGKVKKRHKGLCEIAGINEQTEIVTYRGERREAEVYPKYELVGFHTGRRTFATLSLEKGLSSEVVMSITGHKSYASFKRYVQVTEQRKKTAMAEAWGAIPKSNLKAV
jgi:integrase